MNGRVGDNSTAAKIRFFLITFFSIWGGGGSGGTGRKEGCKVTFVGTLDNGPIADTLGQGTIIVRTTAFLSLLHLSTKSFIL